MMRLDRRVYKTNIAISPTDEISTSSILQCCVKDGQDSSPLGQKPFNSTNRLKIQRFTALYTISSKIYGGKQKFIKTHQ